MKSFSSIPVIFLFLMFITLTIPQKIISQSAFDNYSGIPLIIYTEKEGANITQADFNEMASFPPFGVMVPNMSNSVYSRIQTANLKVIPRQVNLDLNNGIKNYIERYTDAHYTTWEAEGINSADGDVNLSYNSSYGNIFTNEYGRSGVKTKTTANVPATLISGPGYRQNVKYKSIEQGSQINYTLKSSILVQYNPSVPNPQQYENQEDVICTLKVTATEIINGTTLGNEITVGTPLVIKVRDITKNTWIDKSIGYDLNSLVQNYLVKTPYMLTSSVTSSVDKAGYIQFKIIWNGLQYLQLYVDKMVVSDTRGRDIKAYNSQQQQNVKDQADDFSSSTVAAWYSLDEPGSIDNYEPYRIVDSLTHVANSNLRLTTSFTTGWNGKYGETGQGSHQYFTYKEFIKRAKPRNIHVNLYNYDYPLKQTETGWRESNIAYITNTILPELNKLDANFGYTIQAAGFNDIVNGVAVEILRKPSTTETLYHANLGLLFGAKELWTYAYYSYNQPSPYTGIRLNGMIDINNNKTDLWYLVKNTIAPRLTGSFGQTLKILAQDIQYPYIDVKAGSVLDYRFINKMEKSTTVNPSDIFYVDLGFFKDNNYPDKKYFMALNRYYSNITNIKYTFKELTTYKNWEVTNFISNSKSTIVTDANNKAVYSDNISIGDAGFYSLLPVVKYGGTVISNETVSGTNDLKAPMTIASGCTLTVSGTYNVYGDIAVNSGGTLIVNSGANLNFLLGTKLTINGTLTANGTSSNRITFNFDSPGTVNNQNGIFITSTGSSSITYCNITNAYKGISITSSTSNTINNNYIYSNTLGVYCLNVSSASMSISNNNIYNNSYDGFYLGSSSLDLSNNKIHDNSRYGIKCYNSSPVIFSNQIYYNDSSGVQCENQSSAMFGQYGDGEGHNIITGNGRRGIYAKDNSNIFLGMGSGTGINSIYSNSSYELETYNTSAISAEKNWWGYPFSSGEFYAQSSSIDWDPIYSPYSQTDPNGGLSKSNSSEESISESGNDSGVFDEDLRQALTQQIKSNFTEAVNLYKNILDNLVSENMTLKQTDKSIFALLYLSNCYERSGRKDFGGFLNTSLKTISSSSSMYPVISKLKSYWLIKDNKFEDALLVLDDLLTKYSSDKEIVKQSLFDKGCIYFVHLNDEQKAKEQFAKLESLFPKDDLVIDSKLLIGEVAPNMQGTEYSRGTVKEGNENVNSLNNEIPTEYALSGNFPNPFNPTTTIKYALPTESNVELKIYDLMGREIRTLVNGNDGIGYKEIMWDGKNNSGNQVSSGIYLYRLVAKSLENGKVFEKSAKMILMK